VGLVWGEDDRLPCRPYRRRGRAVSGRAGRPRALFAAVSDVALVPVLRTLDLPPSGQPRPGIRGGPARRSARLRTCSTRATRSNATCSPGSRRPSVGVVRDAQLPAALDDGTTPPHRLIAHGLLVPIDAQTVELPREVGLACAAAPRSPPSRAPPDNRPDEADLDRLAHRVLDTRAPGRRAGRAVERDAPAVLRAAGSACGLRRTARALDVDEGVAALLVEVRPPPGWRGDARHRADLCRRLSSTPGAAARPRSDGSPRLRLARHDRQPSLIGQRDERDRVITPLGPDASGARFPRCGDRCSACSPTCRGARAGRPLTTSWPGWPGRPRRRMPSGDSRGRAVEADVLGVTAAGG